MKKLTVIISLILFSACSDNAVETLEKVKKPAIVYSIHKASAWYEPQAMSVKDADGKLIKIPEDGLLSIIDHFNINDTIK